MYGQFYRFYDLRNNNHIKQSLGKCCRSKYHQKIIQVHKNREHYALKVRYYPGQDLYMTHFMIQDQSGHGASKEPMNLLLARILRFL